MLDPRLNHVVSVARTGSFTAAARSIGVTQSAVTKSLADLERQLGYSLFHRTSRGALVTEKGRDFVERAARLLEDATDLLHGSSVKGDAFAGVLRIGVCPASLEWRLVEPLALLFQRHPSIRFDVSGSSFERMVQQLRSGAVDVAIGYDAAFGEWPDLQREPVPALKSTLFVRKDHPLLAKSPIAVEDLANYDFASPSDSRPYGAIIRNIYESQGVEWRKRLHIVDYFPIVRRLVATSDTIGVVTASLGATPGFQAQFATLDHLDIFPAADLCIAVRARWDPKPAARALVKAIRDDAATRAEPAR